MNCPIQANYAEVDGKKAAEETCSFVPKLLCVAICAVERREATRECGSWRNSQNLYCQPAIIADGSGLLLMLDDMNSGRNRFTCCRTVRVVHGYRVRTHFK